MATPNEAAPAPAAAPAPPAAEDAKTAKLTPSDQNANSMPPSTPSIATSPASTDEKSKQGAVPAVSPKANDEKSKTGAPPAVSPKNNDDKSKTSSVSPVPVAAPTSSTGSASASKDEKPKPTAGGKEKEEGSGAGGSITGTPSVNAPPNAPSSGQSDAAAKPNTPVSGQTLPNSHALALANAKAAAVLCINPNKAVFSTTGGVSKHLMINKSNDRLAIKIRSSNNFFFRVNPVYSFLDGNSVNELEVIRLNGGGAKQDKLQLIYVICNDADTDPTKLFGLRAKVRSVILPITTALAN